MSLSISRREWAGKNCNTCSLKMKAGRDFWLRLICPGNLQGCSRNVTHIPLPQASFLLADTPPPGRILWLGSRMFLLKLPWGMFPPCHLLAVNSLRLRRDETCKKGACYDLGQVTELLSALVSSSVQFYCEETEIMHAKCFTWWLNIVCAQLMLTFFYFIFSFYEVIF